MVKEVKASALNDSGVLRVIPRFFRAIKERGLGKYLEEELVREGRARDGGAFWIFDGPHEDLFAAILGDKIREVEELRREKSEKERAGGKPRKGREKGFTEY